MTYDRLFFSPRFESISRTYLLNPDSTAYVFIFVHNEDIFHKGFGYIGTNTNNSAEYQAMLTH